MIPPVPANETQRLKALREAGVMDTPAEREFDDLALLAAEICGTPIALVSFVDEFRQWFKAKVGLAVDETPREFSFCAYGLDQSELMLVADARDDRRFRDNPFVTGDPHIRFYAGAPLINAAGETLGSLCVLDRVPRQLTAQQQRALRVLGQNVITLIELRRQVREHQRAEATLRQSEEQQRQLARQLEAERARLEAAQAVAKVGSWETDLATLAVTWSAETHRIFETIPDRFEPTHAGFLQRVHEDDRLAVDQAFRGSVGQDARQEIEHRIVLADGRIKLVEERWQIFHSADGQPIRAVGTCQDITERRRVQQERERLFELSLDLLCVAGFDGRLRQVNPAWTRVLGWTAEELTSRPMNDFVHPDDRAATTRTRDAVVGGQPVLGFENRYRRKDGTYRWLSWNVRSLPEDQQVFSVARDITERKQAEESSRRSTEALVGVVEALQEMATLSGPLLELMKVMAGRAQALTGAVGAVVEILAGEEMIYLAGSGVAAAKHEPAAQIGSVLARLAVQNAAPLVCADTQLDERLDRALCRQAGIRSIAVVPLRDGPRVVGTVEVVSPDPGAFAAAEIGNLQILAESLGTVIQRRQAAEQLRTSEEQYRMLFAHNPHPMWVYDLESLRFLAVNAAAVRQYGYTADEFRAMTIRDIRPQEDLAALERDLSGPALDKKRVARWRHRKKDGAVVEVEVSSDLVMLDGRDARLVLANDVTERVQAEREAARASRALRMLIRCNEALVRAADERELLTSVCQIAVEVGRFRLAWVGFAVDDRDQSIVLQAQAGADPAALAAAALSWSADRPASSDLPGRVIRTGVAAVDRGLNDPLAGISLADQARGRNFRGLVCLPLKDREHTFGVLALYLGEQVELPEEELLVLKELGDDLAFGLLNLRARTERRLTHDAVLTMARGISAAVDSEFFQRLTLSLAEALEAHVGFVAQLDPRNPGGARTLSAVADGQIVPNFSFPLAELPEEYLAQAGEWVVERDAWRRFPQSALLAAQRIEASVGTSLVDAAGRPIGVMFVHFRQALARPDFVVSILKIFAARAAAEILRQTADATTREQAALLDKAQEAIVVRDLDHRITYWNKSAERLYGWTKAEALNISVRELLYQDPLAFDRAMERLLAQGDWVGEVTQLAKDGQSLTIEGHWTLVRDEAGTARSVLAIDTDISERKKLEQQFFRAQRLESIGTLAGGIAHDLNNLLSPILMGVDLLQLGDLAPDLRKSLLENIKVSADRGANLVKQVLSFARGAQGDKVYLDLRRVVREAESLMETSFPKNIAVETRFAAELSLVLADPTQLNQVLVNLCVNARDAMPDGGRILLNVSETDVDERQAAMNSGVQPGRFVVIEVADTGTGMTKQVQDRIFEPFYTTKEFGKGTGLGLATALGIARGHGGILTVDSELGQGSVFRFYLPAQRVGETSLAGAAGAEPLPRGTGELLLLVDDEPAIRHVTQRILESRGYRTLTAANGAEAISRYDEHAGEVALVITDMMMPVMDGAALCAALRQRDPALRILRVSGLNLDGNQPPAPNGDPSWFLAKPYSAGALLQKVRTILAEPPARTGV